ncbi:hypothetical protein Holit_00343 [Hollandina sp. SP2]
MFFIDMLILSFMDKMYLDQVAVKRRSLVFSSLLRMAYFQLKPVIVVNSERLLDFSVPGLCGPLRDSDRGKHDAANTRLPRFFEAGA